MYLVDGLNWSRTDLNGSGVDLVDGGTDLDGGRQELNPNFAREDEVSGV